MRSYSGTATNHHYNSAEHGCIIYSGASLQHTLLPLPCNTDLQQFQKTFELGSALTVTESCPATAATSTRGSQLSALPKVKRRGGKQNKQIPARRWYELPCSPHLPSWDTLLPERLPGQPMAVKKGFTGAPQ